MSRTRARNAIRSPAIVHLRTGDAEAYRARKRGFARRFWESKDASAAERAIDLTVKTSLDSSCYVLGDQQRLKQVLLSLLTARPLWA